MNRLDMCASKFTGLLALFMLFISCNEVKKEQSINKPNVIIVMTDDQGYGDMAHTGNTIIKTPTIDKFASQAVSLSNYHV